MRLKLISHHLYLFGGLLFGFALNDAVAIPFAPLFSVLLLVLSITMIALGYVSLRSTRLEFDDELKQRAIELLEPKNSEQDLTGNVNA